MVYWVLLASIRTTSFRISSIRLVFAIISEFSVVTCCVFSLTRLST